MDAHCAEVSHTAGRVAVNQSHTACIKRAEVSHPPSPRAQDTAAAECRLAVDRVLSAAEWRGEGCIGQRPAAERRGEEDLPDSRLRSPPVDLDRCGCVCCGGGGGSLGPH